MKPKRKIFKISAKNKKAEIWIYEDIGYYWDGITAKQFAEELKKAGEVDEILVHMNSAGGIVFDGIAIYNTLKKNPANVIIEIDGLAASIASLVVMAGDDIRMAENAMMMIHDPWGLAIGSADDLRDYADKLDKVKSVLVDTYAARSGQEAETIENLMSVETWMTAAEAAEYGFVDAVTEEQRMAAYFDLTRFKNTPKELKSAVYTVQPEFKNRKKYKHQIVTRYSV